MKRQISRMVAVAALLAAPAVGQSKIDSSTFGGLRARSIGPAVMSGRIAAIDGVAGDVSTIYAGAASGGVWKTADGGVRWKPIFDDHPQSIGAIRVDPSNPGVVWVGTGESWVRNSVSIGRGVYKSTDAGDSWMAMGLEDTERIARIQVDPEHSDTVFVCATGHLWGANEERGVFKTIDGGETWERVLFVDENTGCSDLAIDPQDASVLYAGMWEFRRYPDFFNSGGAGSGLYKSTDGGGSWRELTSGLPTGEKGRIAVAVAPSRPRRVYAAVESDATALFRSNDLGETWEEVNRSFAVTGRPFYFAHLVVDPLDHTRIYKPGFYLGISDDSGASFSSIFSGFSGVHSDHHALWINPENPSQLTLGTDGGVYMSYDRAASFRLIKALPVSQFYEVSVDMEQPYNVMGGLQDNGTWIGPSRAAGGIRNKDWRNVGFGDGFHAYRDPQDSDVLYVEYQGGQLLRHHLSTGELKSIRPLPVDRDPDYRFNWNTPIHISSRSPDTLYYGAQFLFRSRDQGESWQKISPDLTTNDPERQRQLQSGGLTIDNSTAENNTTIYTISESPLDSDVIWVGTDDGNVQVTRNGGETWTNTSANLEGVPEVVWVSHVEASPHDPGTAHLTLDAHRSGDMTPYVFRTTNFGESWESIATEELDGFAHVVVQDLVNPELLFLGTEMGMYVSISGGQSWARFASGLPKVPVRDIDVHPRDHDLIIATHGRGIFILDDLTPLRALKAADLDSKLVLLPSRDAVMVPATSQQIFPGHDEFVGANPPEAATVFFYQNRRHIFGDMKIEIYDPEGNLVNSISAPKVKGLNRADWPMRLAPPKLPPATSMQMGVVGPRVPEGTYTYKLIKGKETFEGTLSLVPDPRALSTREERAMQQTTALELYGMLEDLTYLVEALLDLKEQADDRVEALGEGSRTGRRTRELADSLEEFRVSLVSTSEAGFLAGDDKLREHIAQVYGAVAAFDGRPTQSQIDRAVVLGGRMAAARERFDELTTGAGIEALNPMLERSGQAPLELLTRESWDESSETVGGSTGTWDKRSLARLGTQPLLRLR